MRIPFKRHQKQMATMRNRLSELNTQLEMLRKEKALSEREEEVKQLISELHPEKKHMALKRIESVLGGVQERIRATPEIRKKRKAKLRSFVKKVVKTLEEAESDRKASLRKKGYYND